MTADAALSDAPLPEAPIPQTPGRVGVISDFWIALRPVAPALAVGLLLFAALFWSEGVSAVSIWEASTAYNHCFFVIPIAGYLAWDRRDDVVGLVARPMPLAGLLMLPIGLLWFATERLGIMEARQLLVIAAVEILFLACLGWRLFWTLSAALLYLVFLVPFGYFLTPWLQDITARFTDVGLTLFGVPHYTDDLIIEIPAGRFLIAEACAGLRFLVASVAFGVLYACLIFRSPGRRIAFFAASVIIPIIANGFRALGIVGLGHILGSAEAAAADHVIYGWFFNSFVIILLILAGMPFREDQLRAPVARPPVVPPTAPSLAWRMQPVMAVLIVGVLAASGPAIAALLDRAGMAANLAAVAPHFVVPSGCVAAPTQDGRVPESRWGVANAQTFTCGTFRMTVLLQVFPPRINPTALAASRQKLSGELASDERIFASLMIPGIEPRRWRTVSTEAPPRMTAMASWLDGQPSTGGLGERLRQARNSLFGARFAPVVLAVSAEPLSAPGKTGSGMAGGPMHQQAERLISVFLNAQADLSQQVAALASQPVR